MQHFEAFMPQLPTNLCGRHGSVITVTHTPEGEMGREAQGKKSVAGVGAVYQTHL
jgi:hypothetical protein